MEWEDLRKEVAFGWRVKDFTEIPNMLRTAQVATDSYPQSLLGIYIQLIIGPAEDDTARILQYVGITASLLSITKACGEWWVRSAKTEPGAGPAPLPKTLQACLFFLPHVVFRSAALAFSGAFLGYFVLIPILLCISIVFCVCLRSDTPYTPYTPDTSLQTLIATIFAPIAVKSSDTSHRGLMKRAITIFTAIFLLTLTFIRVLPEVIQPDDLVSTYGLRHLNFGKSSDNFNVSCAVNTNETKSWVIDNCTNIVEFLGNGTADEPTKNLFDPLNSTTIINDTQSGFQLLCPRDGKSASFNVTWEACEVNRMFLSFESYSNLWYPLLLSLGLYCLLDAILTQWKHPERDQTRWPCSYRLAETIAKN